MMAAMLIAIGTQVADSSVTGYAMLADAQDALTGEAVALVFATADLLPEVMRFVKDNRLSVPVVAVGPASPATGAKAIRLGAVEYLTEPVEPRMLKAVIAKFAETTKIGSGPIAGDPVSEAMYAQAKQFANSAATVLLRGESGSGKEVMAAFIHANSPRAAKPFVAVNCAAIPENLLESELFGHVKGAFSGALADRKGKFLQAHGGTLLLDEISEMDLALQAKLLRAIQERVIDPIGSDKPVAVDIRLIATTNRQLESYVAEGKFREDLYFRLSVVTLDLPPLRERKGDVVPLAQHFIEKYAKANGYPGVPQLSPEAADKLQGCYWKGNVRELENTVHRAILLCGADGREVTADHVLLSPMSLQHMPVALNNENARASISPAASSLAAAAYASGGATTAFVPKRLAEIERETLLATLNYTKGNQQYAADLLGISVTILAEKLAASGLAT
ncbi:MAG: sigma-54-dependent Fis family transcriptional regulator [Alphaproteobacteria bacterium]|nr:MAG: sigma-54-dependent Fis family transcriptional regulator [Alphaproteobacteria bacterium]